MTLTAAKTCSISLGDTVYLGASDSPKRGTIVALNDKLVTFQPEYGSPSVMPRWIAEDLIARGTRTMIPKIKAFIKQYPGSGAEWRAELAMLEATGGQPRRRRSAPGRHR